MFRIYKTILFNLINKRAVTNRALNTLNRPPLLITRAFLMRPVKLHSIPFTNHNTFNCHNFNKYLALTILGWLGFVDEDEEKESELIMTLKRSVLAMQREQHDKAEQLLHIALRLSQQQQNEQGVIYCYDLMANLAMNRLQLDKAEKLFVTVLQMLLSSGLKENNLKV